VKVPAVLPSQARAAAGLTLGLDAGEIKILPARAEESACAYTMMMMMDVMLTEFAPQGTWVTCGRDGVRLTGLCDTGLVPTIGTSAMLAISLDKAFWFERATGVTLAAPIF
jgi:hypothetical protein